MRSLSDKRMNEPKHGTIIGGIIRMCERLAASGGTPLLILLDYFLSGIDVRGKGFHEVVLAPLRLTSIPDILSDAEEGYPFFLFPW